MFCELCKQKKLRREFPTKTLIDECNHAALHCLRVSQRSRKYLFVLIGTDTLHFCAVVTMRFREKIQEWSKSPLPNVFSLSLKNVVNNCWTGQVSLTVVIEVSFLSRPLTEWLVVSCVLQTQQRRVRKEFLKLTPTLLALALRQSGALETLCGGQFTLSTRSIKPNCLVKPQPT